MEVFPLLSWLKADLDTSAGMFTRWWSDYSHNVLLIWWRQTTSRAPKDTEDKEGWGMLQTLNLLSSFTWSSLFSGTFAEALHVGNFSLCRVFFNACSLAGVFLVKCIVCVITFDETLFVWSLIVLIIKELSFTTPCYCIFRTYLFRAIFTHCVLWPVRYGNGREELWINKFKKC